MDRRAYLKKVTTVAAAGLAGCVAPNAETETPAGETPTGAGTPTSTAGETETPGEEGTETPTDGGTPAGEGTPTGDAELPSTVQMVTEDGEYYFDPVGLLVEQGETITWRIESGAHSATAYHPDNDDASRIPEGAEPWDSGILSEQGATFEYTFEVGGTYDYYCTPHKTLGMVGRIVVESPGGPAENSPIPNGDVPDSETIVERGAVSWGEFTG